MTSSAKKDAIQRDTVQRLHSGHNDHAVLECSDNHNIFVFVSDEHGELSTWPSDGLSPYSVKTVIPLGDGAYFDCFAVMGADWTKVDEVEP